jgi:hypothetical protein
MGWTIDNTDELDSYLVELRNMKVGQHFVDCHPAERVLWKIVPPDKSIAVEKTGPDVKVDPVLAEVVIGTEFLPKGKLLIWSGDVKMRPIGE